MYRILIVDDEEYVRDLLVKNIRSSSLEVEVTGVAGDGKEGLELALKLKPDVVITDISMPFLNGLELIREMQNAGLHSKYVVISGYDEFDYARQAMSLGVTDYLLKPFLPRELLEVLQKLTQELDRQKTLQQNMSLLKEQALAGVELAREKALKALLSGKECGEELQVYDRGLKDQSEEQFYLAGVLRLSGGNWDFGNQEQVEEFLTLVREGYFPKWIGIDGVSFDGLQLAMVWQGTCDRQEKFIKMVRSGLEKILVSLEKYYHIGLQCAVGRPYTGERELEKSYREAMAVWRGMLGGEQTILFYGEEGRENEENTSSQIRDCKSRIRMLVRTGQAAEAVSQLQNLMKCYASLSSKKNDYISISIGELVYAIHNDMENAGYDGGDGKTMEVFNDRIHYGSLGDMKEMLESYIIKCCREIAENSEETRAEAVVEQIRMLIENHMGNENLELEWIAEQVHFSISYVRQIFKQHTGESFGEYLIRKRMEKAGKMLQESGLKIQVIAQECGYENQRYFASSFKKFYGCTPTEFKRAVEENHLY